MNNDAYKRRISCLIKTKGEWKWNEGEYGREIPASVCECLPIEMTHIMEINTLKISTEIAEMTFTFS